MDREFSDSPTGVCEAPRRSQNGRLKYEWLCLEMEMPFDRNRESVSFV